ncbi:hypothetical protein H696_00958 [Fonticula alba]|uniref:Uncharacterized protein n=1 Tax=Fonticula alba TaxID=691883 RepID=A0A058ZHI4_FONAL|nr:hypothetical protein H696_00958 [Fonticula alba]KCV73421.1 hypothetical protein H696_00958 [Fonticula alba]|eukprot:XP_009493122.1 hypothetical protein H696_00958 [Fonticula alba]
MSPVPCPLDPAGGLVSGPSPAAPASPPSSADFLSESDLSSSMTDLPPLVEASSSSCSDDDDDDDIPAPDLLLAPVVSHSIGVDLPIISERQARLDSLLAHRPTVDDLVRRNLLTRAATDVAPAVRATLSALERSQTERALMWALEHRLPRSRLVELNMLNDIDADPQAPSRRGSIPSSSRPTCPKKLAELAGQRDILNSLDRKLRLRPSRDMLIEHNYLKVGQPEMILAREKLQRQLTVRSLSASLQTRHEPPSRILTPTESETSLSAFDSTTCEDGAGTEIPPAGLTEASSVNTDGSLAPSSQHLTPLRPFSLPATATRSGLARRIRETQRILAAQHAEVAPGAGSASRGIIPWPQPGTTPPSAAVAYAIANSHNYANAHHMVVGNPAAERKLNHLRTLRKEGRFVCSHCGGEDHRGRDLASPRYSYTEFFSESEWVPIPGQPGDDPADAFFHHHHHGGRHSFPGAGVEPASEYATPLRRPFHHPEARARQLCNPCFGVCVCGQAAPRAFANLPAVVEVSSGLATPGTAVEGVIGVPPAEADTLGCDNCGSLAPRCGPASVAWWPAPSHPQPRSHMDIERRRNEQLDYAAQCDAEFRRLQAAGQLPAVVDGRPRTGRRVRFLGIDVDPAGPHPGSASALSSGALSDGSEAGDEGDAGSGEEVDVVSVRPVGAGRPLFSTATAFAAFSPYAAGAGTLDEEGPHSDPRAISGVRYFARYRFRNCFNDDCYLLDSRMYDDIEGEEAFESALLEADKAASDFRVRRREEMAAAGGRRSVSLPEEDDSSMHCASDSDTDADDTYYYHHQISQRLLAAAECWPQAGASVSEEEEEAEPAEEDDEAAAGHHGDAQPQQPATASVSPTEAVASLADGDVPPMSPTVGDDDLPPLVLVEYSDEDTTDFDVEARASSGADGGKQQAVDDTDGDADDDGDDDDHDDHDDDDDDDDDSEQYLTCSVGHDDLNAADSGSAGGYFPPDNECEFFPVENPALRASIPGVGVFLESEMPPSPIVDPATQQVSFSEDIMLSIPVVHYYRGFHFLEPDHDGNVFAIALDATRRNGDHLLNSTRVYLHDPRKALFYFADRGAGKVFCYDPRSGLTISI